MQNRYVGDIGDFVKLSILRTLSPGYRLGVAWWLFPDETHNRDGRHVSYLDQPEHWRHLDPNLFDALAMIVASQRRDVRALEAPDILPGAIFASEVMPVGGPVADRPRERRQWFTRVQATWDDANMVFLDPDNGLEPAGYSHGSSKAGKSILISELHELARPGRCLIAYHHHTRRAGGHHSEVAYWVDRLRASGFSTVDALRARSYSPRVFFLLGAPEDVRQRAEQIAARWVGLIMWHTNASTGGGDNERAPSGYQPNLTSVLATSVSRNTANGRTMPLAPAPEQSARRRSAGSTQIGYVNRNQQEVIRGTGIPGTDHGQYVYVLRCRACGHEYGANGSDIWLRRCPAHDRGAPGTAF